MSGYKYNKGFFDDFGDGGSVLNQLNYVPAVGEPHGMVGSAGLEPATSCL